MNAAKIESHNPWIGVILWGIAAFASTVALIMLDMNHPVACIAGLVVAGCFAVAGHRAEKKSKSR